MTVSLLLPYRADFGWRDRLFRFVTTRCAEIMPNVELVIGRDAGEGPFNCAAALNDAASRAHGDMLFMVGSDWLPDPEAVQIVQRNAAAWVTPYYHTALLSKRCTQAILDGADPELEVEQLDLSCNGSFAVSRRAWGDGLDERFRGWGEEDRAFRAVLEERYGVPRSGGRFHGVYWHLWHPPADRSHLAANRAIYDRDYAK